jgi:hypothetical protein
MTNSGNVYIFEEHDRQPRGTRYFFVSEGDRLLIKVVEYRFIGLKEGKHTYNLGFGTYNKEGNLVCDDDISENGDTYKVFNTVLSTIPHFLHNYTGALVMVEGSDSIIPSRKPADPIVKRNVSLLPVKTLIAGSTFIKIS